MPRSTALTLVIPVYNEGANFPVLWQQLSAEVKTPFRALVVYDFDQDNTIPVASGIAAGDTRLALIKNAHGRGVVGAIRTGFDQAGDGPALIVMADLSDDLAQVPAMLALYEQGYDLVVGSRYMKGGRLVGGPWFKQLLSRGAGVSLHWLRGLPTHDATNAFKLCDAAMVRSLDLQSQGGFELSLEITVKAYLCGYRIGEVPTTWRDRTAGESRFRLWKWLPLYLKWYFYVFRPRARRA